MERNKILNALSNAYEDIFGEYQTLSELASELLRDGEDKAYQVIARRAHSKSNVLDGIQLAAAALGISWDELLEQTRHEEVQL